MTPSFVGAVSTSLQEPWSTCKTIIPKNRRRHFRHTTERLIRCFQIKIKNTVSMSEKSKKARYDDDGTRVVPVPLFIHGTSEESVTGVYGVLDENRELVYVGMSRDIAASLEAHAAQHGDEVFYVRVMTFAKAAVHEMKRMVNSWLLDNETTPIGNIEQWYEVDEELTRQASALSPIEVSDTFDENQALPIVSPFENDPLGSNSAPFSALRNADVVDGVSSETSVLPRLTLDNVDEALDEVRPFLVSDGGNISVMHVDTNKGLVKVRLEGACESCSSATTTMRMGVEKALRKRFGDQINHVVAIDGGEHDDDLFLSDGPTIDSCEVALDSIRDVLHGLNAQVSVVEVDEDEVVVSFRGPHGLKFGIEQTLREKVRGVSVVTFE